jgi:hypothetical protein
MYIGFKVENLNPHIEYIKGPSFLPLHHIFNKQYFVSFFYYDHFFLTYLSHLA